MCWPNSVNAAPFWQFAKRGLHFEWSDLDSGNMRYESYKFPAKLVRYCHISFLVDFRLKWFVCLLEIA